MDALIQKLISGGWQELELGLQDWRWFIKGVENAYIYKLTGQIFYAENWRAVVAKLPMWIKSRGTKIQTVIDIYFVDPATIKQKRVIQGKLREGSGNTDSITILKIKE